MIISVKNISDINIRNQTGIYLIRCKSLDKIYIGSTTQNFRARFSNHCKFLLSNSLGNKELQNDYNTYGADNFEFEVLETCSENIVNREQYYINLLQPYYNKLKASNNSKTNLNKKFSSEHIEKIRLKAKLYRHDTNTRELLTQLNKENASCYRITNTITGETILGAFKDIELFFGTVSFYRCVNSLYKKVWFIEKLRKQSKSIYLFIDNDWVEFTSYEKCDKFLNKWRGFTSTKMLKKCVELNGYLVKQEL